MTTGQFSSRRHGSTLKRANRSSMNSEEQFCFGAEKIDSPFKTVTNKLNKENNNEDEAQNFSQSAGEAASGNSKQY